MSGVTFEPPGRAKNKFASQRVQKHFKNKHRPHRGDVDLSLDIGKNVCRSDRSLRQEIMARQISAEYDSDDYDSFVDSSLTSLRGNNEGSGSESNLWICDKCTFLNNADVNTCVTCEHQRNVTNKTKPQEVSSNAFTLSHFLTKPQTMDLDDDIMMSDEMLQSAIHSSLQDASSSASNSRSASPRAENEHDTPSPSPSASADEPSPTCISYATWQAEHQRFSSSNQRPPTPRHYSSYERNTPERRADMNKKNKRVKTSFSDYWSEAQQNIVPFDENEYNITMDDDGDVGGFNSVPKSHYSNDISFTPVASKERFGLRFGVPRMINEAPSSFGRVGKREDPRKAAREAQKGENVSKYYEHVYKAFCVNTNERESLTVCRIIRQMYTYVPNNLRQRKEFDNKTFTTCQSCYSVDFQSPDDSVVIPHCGHRVLCVDCFRQYLKIRVDDEDVMPWFPCPMPDCKTCVTPNLVIHYLSLENKYKFASIFLRNHLVRNSNWIACENEKNCKYGFIHLNSTQSIEKTCDACGFLQVVGKPATKDEGLQELIRNGTLRLCPKCEWPTMKDYGMCNVINCGNCGIWWNWRTRETGTNSTELKNRARRMGAMWEPGELEYQWHLQDTNLPAFIDLLARNGIKYDPNYVRGTG